MAAYQQKYQHRQETPLKPRIYGLTFESQDTEHTFMDPAQGFLPDEAL